MVPGAPWTAWARTNIWVGRQLTSPTLQSHGGLLSGCGPVPAVDEASANDEEETEKGGRALVDGPEVRPANGVQLDEAEVRPALAVNYYGPSLAAAPLAAAHADTGALGCTQRGMPSSTPPLEVHELQNDLRLAPQDVMGDDKKRRKGPGGALRIAPASPMEGGGNFRGSDGDLKKAGLSQAALKRPSDLTHTDGDLEKACVSQAAFKRLSDLTHAEREVVDHYYQDIGVRQCLAAQRAVDTATPPTHAQLQSMTELLENLTADARSACVLAYGVLDELSAAWDGGCSRAREVVSLPGARESSFVSPGGAEGRAEPGSPVPAASEPDCMGGRGSSGSGAAALATPAEAGSPS